MTHIHWEYDPVIVEAQKLFKDKTIIVCYIYKTDMLEDVLKGLGISFEVLEPLQMKERLSSSDIRPIMFSVYERAYIINNKDFDYFKLLGQYKENSPFRITFTG